MSLEEIWNILFVISVAILITIILAGIVAFLIIVKNKKNIQHVSYIIQVHADQDTNPEDSDTRLNGHNKFFKKYRK